MRVFIILAMLLVAVQADMYLHNPPGSNNRNRERNDNRNNGNRLFDSQNNGKGGYPWPGVASVQQGPDPITLYAGSLLRMEWTNQHACGMNDNDVCQVIIQAGFDTQAGWDQKQATRAPGTASLKGARDGYPYGEVDANSDNNNAGYLIARFTGEAGQNAQGTNTIPSNKFANDPVKREQFYTQGLLGGGEFGMHEHYDMYRVCETTERNKGLYTADQKVNRNDMRGTRQNPNGARRGLECPEERDYYPHWNPLIGHAWDDVAALVSNTRVCDHYQKNSMNVKAYGYCSGGTASKKPITEGACTSTGGTWTMVPGKGIDAPDCRLGMFGRDNHLGNAVKTDSDGNPKADFKQPETAHYLWKIPGRYVGKRIVMRLRYNISTTDYQEPLNGFTNRENAPNFVDFAFNCPRITLVDNAQDVDDLQASVDGAPCTNLITANRRPMYNRPYVHVFPGMGNNMRLSIAINTNQAGRTFQDRTYMINVAAMPDKVADGAVVHNLNLRGRRGNIVQCYPSVEYDFVPSMLKLEKRDWVHIQFWGSDFNAAKNANNGEGWQYSTRTNMVQMQSAGYNFPAFHGSASLFGEPLAKRFAYGDQNPANCEEYENGDANEQNSITNCGKLNQMSARWPATPSDTLLQVGADTGTYEFVSTRNNNFSNRSQKGKFIIGGASGLTASEIAGIVVGSAVFAGLVVMGVCFYGYKRKNTVAGRWYAKSSEKCAPLCGPVCGRCTGFCATQAQKEGFQSQKSTNFGGTTKPKMVAPPDLEHTRY